jgi:hypothetical protein
MWASDLQLLIDLSINPFPGTTCKERGVPLFEQRQTALLQAGPGTRFAVGPDQRLYHEGCHRHAFHPKCSVCTSFLPEQGGVIRFHHHPFWANRWAMQDISQRKRVISNSSCRIARTVDHMQTHTKLTQLHVLQVLPST